MKTKKPSQQETGGLYHGREENSAYVVFLLRESSLVNTLFYFLCFFVLKRRGRIAAAP